MIERLFSTEKRVKEKHLEFFLPPQQEGKVLTISYSSKINAVLYDQGVSPSLKKRRDMF
jgi:hypothetical protein